MSGKTMWDTQLDPERKHLENLLKDRINFYVIFAPVYLAGAFQVTDPNLHASLLWAGFIVSAAMFVAIVRTTWLVQRALNRLSPEHPYIILKRGLGWLPNANFVLPFIPGLSTLLFLWLAIGAPHAEAVIRWLP